MLKLMSRFVLEVLPHLLSALIAAIVVPGFLSSQFHDRQPVGAANGPDSRITLALVRHDHAAYAPGEGISRLSSSIGQRQPIEK
jgi:hypothetical protein